MHLHYDPLQALRRALEAREFDLTLTRFFANLVPAYDQRSAEKWGILEYLRWGFSLGARTMVWLAYLYGLLAWKAAAGRPPASGGIPSALPWVPFWCVLIKLIRFPSLRLRQVRGGHAGPTAAAPLGRGTRRELPKRRPTRHRSVCSSLVRSICPCEKMSMVACAWPATRIGKIGRAHV